MLQFEENYFEGEEREGFYVSPMMKRVWAGQLEVLRMVDEICSCHNIRYFADWGTLLGAIRHKGYVPWDDDLDICMLRPDYERFLSIVKQYPPKYCQLLNADTQSAWNSEFAKIVNSMDLPLEKDIEERFHNCPYLVGVDIFPIDYLPNNEEEQNTHIDLFRAVYYLALDIREERKATEEHIQQLNMLQELCNVRFHGKTPIEQQLQILADRIAAMYMDMGQEAKECTLMYYRAGNEQFHFPSSCFAESIRVPFENISIPIPVGYEKILTVYYGEDYMTPMQNFAQHEYPFYKKQQKYLIDYYEKNNLPVPEYLTEE